MGRIAEFDALRGLAAVAILLLHLHWLPDSPWVYSAVDLFFVLSGYLITANVLKYRTSPNFLPVFFARRALRIWPAYYLALAVCLLLNHKFKRLWDFPPTAWPYYATFTQNLHDYFGWPSPLFSGMFLHTWTLAIEEQFYMVWPLLLPAAARVRWGVPAAVLTCVLVPPWLRSCGYMPHLLLSRGDGLALGGLLAVCLADTERVTCHLRSYRLGFAAVALAALGVPPLLGLFFDSVPTLGPFPPHAIVGDPLFTTRVTLAYFGLAGLVLCSRGHPALRTLRDPRLVYLGVVSYALYLYHPLVYGAFPHVYRKHVVRRLGWDVPVLMDLLMLGLCLVLAELSRRWVEAPCQVWKDRLAYRPAVDAAVPGLRGPHLRPQVLSNPATTPGSVPGTGGDA